MEQGASPVASDIPQGSPKETTTSSPDVSNSTTSASAASSSMTRNNSLKFAGTVSRFCDYFVICGLDYNSGLEVLPSYESDGNCKSFFLTLDDIMKKVLMQFLAKAICYFI